MFPWLWEEQCQLNISIALKEQTMAMLTTGKKEKSEQNAGTDSLLSETKPGAINAAAGRVL